MDLLDYILPRNCLLCDRTFPSDGLRPTEPSVCPACRTALRPTTIANRCTICSIPLPQFIKQCERCRREGFTFIRAYAPHRYDGAAAQLVQAFKFGRHPSLGRYIGELMTPHIGLLEARAAPLVPVPSRRRTVRARGFAGASIIADEIARRTGRRVLPLLTASGRRSQKTLSYTGRRENASATMGLAREAVVPHEIILVDDIFTTGTTAESCARRLAAGGARRIFVFAFALDY